MGCRHGTALDGRRSQWELIKQRSPDVAALMVEINAAFGKPSAFRIEYDDGLVVESGEFARSKLGNIRRVKDGKR